MRKHTTLFFICISLLTACSSEKDPTEANFVKAVNKVLHQESICFADKALMFPNTLSSAGKSKADLIAKYDALYASGLVSRTLKSMKIDRPDKKIDMEKAWHYDLTGTGYQASKVLKDEANKPYRRFCFAKAHAVGVKNSTPPEKVGDQTIARVTYLYSITQVSEWAQQEKLLAQYPDVKSAIDTLSKPVEKEAILILDKKGWIYKPQ